MSETLETPAGRPGGSVLVAAVKQLRPKQWTKQVFLLPALIFSGQFLDPISIQRSMMGFAAFCMLSSSGYVLNDYLDREADRRHPKKRHRPIASGALPVPAALVLMVVVFAMGVALSWSLGPLFLFIGLAYLSTTLSYSFYFKHVVILDVMFLASGFVWRTMAGAVAIQVRVSAWLLLCTAFLSLFLGFNKRRGELMQLGANAGTRKNLADYSPAMLSQIESIVTGNAVLSYSLYAILGPTPWMAVTIPFVLYAIFRYVYLVEQCGEGSAPDETVLKDMPLLLTCLLYGMAVIGVLLLDHGGWLDALVPPAPPLGVPGT